MQRVKNGDILEIPLNNSYGFGYAKYLKSRIVWSSKNLPDVLRIFLFSSTSKINDIGIILNKELLIAPIAIAGTNGILKSGWRVVGNEIINENERFLPHVKNRWPPLVADSEKWVYYEDLGDTTKMHYADYNEVKHLEYSRVLNIALVPLRITMELMKLEGKDISLLNDDLDWLQQIEYNQSYDIPSYSNLPSSLKGRVNK